MFRIRSHFFKKRFDEIFFFELANLSDIPEFKQKARDGKKKPQKSLSFQIGLQLPQSFKAQSDPTFGRTVKTYGHSSLRLTVHSLTSLFYSSKSIELHAVSESELRFNIRSPNADSVNFRQRVPMKSLNIVLYHMISRPKFFN